MEPGSWATSWRNTISRNPAGGSSCRRRTITPSGAERNMNVSLFFDVRDQWSDPVVPPIAEKSVRVNRADPDLRSGTLAVAMSDRWLERSRLLPAIVLTTACS